VLAAISLSLLRTALSPVARQHRAVPAEAAGRGCPRDPDNCGNISHYNRITTVIRL
jgi:hypothetical protein